MATGGELWITDAAAADRPHQWQRMLSATHLPWAVSVPVQPPGMLFEAWIRRWWIADLALVDCECGPCSGTRQRRQLAETDGEFVVVLITKAGSETVAQGTAEATMRPGDAVAWDSRKPARFQVWEPLAKRSLLIPRAALDEVGGRSLLTGGVLLDGTAPATRLLTSYLDTLRQALPELSPAAVVAARNATLELFIGALRADTAMPSSNATWPALRATMDRFIERHLLDSVTPASVASAHGVSIRTVNRIFNATGQTVGEVVRMRRLARARDELTQSNQSISAIAHRWGFSDSSHFSRSFKARYGRSPTEYRQSLRDAGVSVQGVVAVVQGDGGEPVETERTAARG